MNESFSLVQIATLIGNHLQHKILRCVNLVMVIKPEAGIGRQETHRKLFNANNERTPKCPVVWRFMPENRAEVKVEISDEQVGIAR